jgi:hypothetical protein
MASNLFEYSPDPVPVQATNNKRTHSTNFAMASNLFDHSPGLVPFEDNNKRAYTSELSKLSATATKTGRSQLGVDFQPSEHSVICGRGKESYNHAGNHCFRILTGTFVERYSRADSKTAKSAFVYNIVTMIRQAGGNFCKYEKGAWFEVGDHCAREKVSSLFRDMLHTQYRSSAKAKITRRSIRNRNKTQIQQHGQQLVGTGGYADADAEDSSIISGELSVC